ncbi:MAG TPA: hypothetical protein VE934_06650 [Polaromonas sp.]|uniref:hypothetical protein n=1 Tax=Polaromonas sp. TaxID=1869339 RepID=UPI002D74AB92|nr:hypothetical protein [Polaromonas sp.]HYW56619.1 hypothetical protein [Polaromonas sp.]
MRIFILALMIALLPVRGWVGDAMATSMAAGHAQQVATKKIAKNLDESRAEARFDHHAAMGGGAQDASDCAGHVPTDVTAEADTNCESCSACQACHTVALSPATPDSGTVFHAFELIPAASHSFASADAALGQKPPIS